MAAQHWDAIVIGTGMGGGIAGRRLAERGLSVLFIEKGPVGFRTESQGMSDDVLDEGARLSRGMWPTPVELRLDDNPPTRFFAPLGAGVGGSSVFYAAALEQPERHDLESVPGLAHPTGGWPVGFDAFLPYFREAAAILSARGEADPLNGLPGPDLPAPPLTEAEARLFQDLRDLGLHPYRTPEALRRLPDCADCLGHKCPRPCKMDGRSAGVEPALATGNARLMADCSVREVVEGTGRVDGVRVSTAGQEFVLRGSTFVLAAGALHSPRILLRSTGRRPEGCANSSGWVGRGLMFHLNELFALWPRRGNPSVGATRTVSFRDLYAVQGQRLGLVQSMGVASNAGQIAAYLKGILRQTWLHRLPGMGKLATLTAVIAARLFGSATVFVGLLEDMPRFDNRVLGDPENPEIPVIVYRIPDELRARRALFRRAIRERLGKRRTRLLGFGPAPNFGHPSGTLRFGADPASSVLNGDCRAHDLDNLFVVDASFMPSSTGVNPSLTIAANALRVADIIAERHLAAIGVDR